MSEIKLFPTLSHHSRLRDGCLRLAIQKVNWLSPSPLYIFMINIDYWSCTTDFVWKANKSLEANLLSKKGILIFFPFPQLYWHAINKLKSYIFKVYSMVFLIICIHCEMMATIKTINRSVIKHSEWWELPSERLSANFKYTIPYSIINYNHHAVH